MADGQGFGRATTTSLPTSLLAIRSHIASPTYMRVLFCRWVSYCIGTGPMHPSDTDYAYVIPSRVLESNGLATYLVVVRKTDILGEQT